MSAGFARSLAALASVPDSRLGRPWRWPDRPGQELQARDALHLAFERELEASSRRQPVPLVAARLYCSGQRAWGDLRGLLAGVDDGLLDREPEPGEWPLRRVLGHVLLVERRYRVQCEHALHRSPGDPVYVQLDFELEPDELDGGALDLVARLETERAATAALATVPDSELGRPTVWAGFEVDLRFRLGRFAAHLAEHTIQVDKALASLGRAPTEATRLARLVSAERGGHELYTPEAERAGLDSELAGVVAELAVDA